MPSSRSSNNATLAASVAIITTIAVVSAVLFRQRNTKDKKDLGGLEDELKELDLKEETAPDDNNNNKTHSTLEKQADEEGILVKPIGTVNSIYRLCVGTPRQGLLAPDARGRIQLAKFGDANAGDAVIGLEEYSHIWVLFHFHLNTQSKNSKRVKTKVAPPALGGKKVGILATRTPHRFNPIGITLCKLDKIERKNKEVVLHVSGLDLVDGTPIFDIKPYVPFYDSVDLNNVKLPPWVPEGLSTRRNVTITQLAQEELKDLLQNNSEALQFYGKKHGDKSLEGTVDVVTECIRQVLAVDVRSSYQTKKARQGKFQAERSARLEDKDAAQNAIQNICTQQLDNLLIQYTVTEAADRQNSQSQGSGAEDGVFVKSIQLLKTKEEAEAAMEKASEEIEPEEVKVREVTFSSPKKQPPADSGDYPTLKKYWNEAANENPEEISPTKKIISRNGVESSSSDAYAEAAKKLAEEEGKRAEEKTRLKVEAEAAKKLAEEEAKRAEEQTRLEVEAEAAKKLAEEEAKQAEEQAKLKAEAAAAEAAKKLAEEEAKRAEEQTRLKVEAEAATEAAKKLAEDEAKQAEDQAKLKAEAEAAKKLAEEEEDAWVADLAKEAEAATEAAKKLAEEEAKQAEEEAKLKAEAAAEEAKKLAEEEEAAWVADLAEARAAREVMEAEDERVAAEEQRLAEEKAEKEKIIAAEKAAMENKLAEEKAANEKSLADEKAAKEQKLAEEKNATEQAEEQARLKAEVKAAVEAEKELVAANAVEAAKASTKNEEPQVAVAEESQTPWEPGMVTCSVCAAAKAKSEYSKVQLKKKTFKCKECVAKQTS